MKEIKTVIYHKQCKEYYEALEKQDWFAVNIWFQPPTYRRWEDIKAEMKMNQLEADFQAEKERINAMPKELLKIELETKLGYKREVLPKSFFEQIFGL